MAQTITLVVANQKGGCGKSTTAHAIAAGLTKRGYRVLSLDLDGQRNLTHTAQAAAGELGSMELLTGAARAEQTIQATPESGDIIAASPHLNGDAIESPDVLKRALTPVRARYDFIVIDTPPALGMLTINALTAADGVIIPAGADAYSIQGIADLNATIETVKARSNPNLHIAGILLTRYSWRAILSRDLAAVIAETAAALNTKVFDTRIREGVAIREAQAMQQSVFSYAPRSNPAKDYTAFLDEVLTQYNKPKKQGGRNNG